MMAVVAMAVVATVTTAVTWQLLAGRRMLEQRQRQLQAEWLARAGVEIAAARLLVDPTGYQGELMEMIPESQLPLSDFASVPSARGLRRTAKCWDLLAIRRPAAPWKPIAAHNTSKYQC